jgi:hypothetical protein
LKKNKRTRRKRKKERKKKTIAIAIAIRAFPSSLLVFSPKKVFQVPFALYVLRRASFKVQFPVVLW